MYSLYATKTISTGEGGLLVSANEDLIDYSKSYRNYGKFDYKVEGLNYRMNEFTAAIGCIQTDRLEDIVAWKNIYVEKNLNPNYSKRLILPGNMISGFYKYIVFEEIENDNQATIQAVAVVLVASFCAGIGSLSLNSVDPSVLDLVLSSFTSLIRWAFLALITYFLGSTLFKTENTNVTWGQLARTMGFAQSPAILVSFGYFSQTVFSYLTVIVTFWLIATMVIAVRQSLDYKMNLSGSLRAFVVVVLASIPGLIINYSILSISS